MRPGVDRAVPATSPADRIGRYRNSATTGLWSLTREPAAAAGMECDKAGVVTVTRPDRATGGVGETAG